MKRFFLIFFAICAAVTTFADTFRRVSAPQADWTGEYLLVFESADSCRVFSGVDAAMGSEVVEITNSTISDYSGPTLVVAALADGGYSIAVNGGSNNGKYISSGSSAPAWANALKFNTTPHRVDLDYVNGSVLMSQSLQVNGQDTLVKMRFNDKSDQMRFRFYKTGQLPIQLYKLSSGDDQDSTANPILPIAQVKALDDASNVRLSGVVTHVYNKNAWIQDATGGMLLFFTASPSVSVGDEVVVSGVKTTYAGAPEVSYSVIETTISTGNEVAEVQCASLAAACQENLMFTKVHLENLEIVSFNNSGNPYVTDGSDTLLCYRMIPDSSFVMGSHINLTAIVNYYNGYQFVGDVAGIQLAQQPSLDSVAFNVIVPANTPDCYIAGNFNGWTHQQMTKLTDSTYTYVYSAVNLIIDSLEYKYCAGNGWDYVEKDSLGWEVPNRRWQALDRVATWAAVPGDTLPQDTVPGEQPTSVTFHVWVPDNTPACYIAGNFNNWTLQQMTMVSATSYTLTIDSVLPSMLEYKYCAGNGWEYVEVDAEGYHVMNRRWAANDTVRRWAAIPVVNVITYELNGGVTNDYGWCTPDSMFATFMAESGATGFSTLAEYKALADPLGGTGICGKLSHPETCFADSAKWGWLLTYIMSVHAAQTADGASALTAAGAGAAWRYAVGAFFVDGKRASWPKSANFATCGVNTYGAYSAVWKHAFANPTAVTETFTLNEPYKEGFTFDGWYTSADFSGAKVTTIDATTTGTLYAKWIEYIPTLAEVKAMADTTITKASGVVTFINGKNVYVQDATGGLLLYMKANPTFTVGDKVVVSGTKVMYGGAPELRNGVEVSAVADSIPAAASFATFADACQEANMFTLVNVNNLEIVSFDSYNNPSVSDGMDTLLCYRMAVDTAVFKVGTHVDVTAVLGYFNGYQFVGDVAGIQLAQQPSLDSVAFNVIVPANTPDCYIAGNFNGWTHQQMTKLTDSTYTYVYSAVNLIIDSLEYKYCAGNGWDYVEKDANGYEVPKRRWQALDRVATWAVVPGDTLPQDTVPGEQPTVPTIAQVKALENNTETQVAGVVTFINSKNVYVQDATGGLLLYMKANPTFNVGDQVVVSGTKAMYGGAPELKNGVEVSAVADSIPAAASFATLADACQEANMFTLVNMNNLEIVSLDSYNNPSVSDGMDTLLCYRMAVDTAVFKVGTHVNVTAVLGYYKGYQFVGDVAGIQLAQQPSLDSVAFNVIVPANTPACYIAGNFNGWTHQQMTKLTDSTYTYVYSAVNLIIDSLEYKYCAGPDWAYVEKDAQGMEIMNRRWQAQDRVATWFAVPDEITDVNWALSIYEGHWSMEYAAFQSANTGYYGEVVNLSKNGGYVSLVLTQEMLDAARTQQGWGGIFVLNGDNVICHHVILEHAGTIDTIWVGNAVADNWENQPYIGSDGGAELANAQVGDIVKFLITAVDIPQVIFTVVVPSNTENCYIAGNFNNWTHQQMIQYDDTLYSFSYSAIDLVVDSIEYKYCAGPGWAYVEKDAEGLDVPNRKWQPLDTVVAWENTRLVHNGLHYEITSMNTVCVIPASDNEGNGNYLWLTDVVIPDTVVFNNTTYQVTGIAEMAFAGCRTMTSLVVGKNIEQIGLLAFQNCSNLTSVVWNATNCSSIVIDNNVYPFFYSVQSITSFTFGNSVEFVPAALCAFMENLTSITIPEGVSVLDGYVFYYCSSLASITLPSTLTYINANAFNGCEGLTKTNFTGNLKQWCEMIIFEGGSPVMYSHNLYLNDVLLTHADIPEGTTMVNDYAFANDTCLISAKVPNSVEYIGLYAFNNCTNIRSIEVGNGVSELALTDYNYSYAFSECYNLQKFVYRSSLADDLRLGDYWLNATNLDTLIVPTEMLELDDDWAALKSIVPSHIRYIEVLEGELGSSSLQFFGLSAASLQTLNLAAASNTTLEDKAFYEFYNLTNLSLPLGLQTIPYKMVADCYMLSSISIPSSVTSIGNNAFENCRSLSSVDFGTMTALQQIGNWAFYNCHNLPTLTIPEGVTYVGDGAFYGCSYLTELTLPSTMLTMGDNSFALCSRLQKMNVSAAIPPTIASKTFKDVLRSIPVYVPQPSVSLYKTDEYWKEFNIIGSEEQESAVDNISTEGTTKIYRDGYVLIYHNGTYYDMMGNVVE